MRTATSASAARSASSETSRDLPIPGSPATSTAAPLAGPRVVHRALELRELTGASNERTAGPGFHLDQYPAAGS